MRPLLFLRIKGFTGLHFHKEMRRKGAFVL